MARTKTKYLGTKGSVFFVAKPIFLIHINRHANEPHGCMTNTELSNIPTPVIRRHHWLFSLLFYHTPKYDVLWLAAVRHLSKGWAQYKIFSALVRTLRKRSSAHAFTFWQLLTSCECTAAAAVSIKVNWACTGHGHGHYVTDYEHIRVHAFPFVLQWNEIVQFLTIYCIRHDISSPEMHFMVLLRSYLITNEKCAICEY